MFWTVVLIAPTLFVLNSVIEYVYPGKIKTAMMKIGWSAMELCTKVEIAATQIYNSIPPVFAKQPPKTMIKFICDGNEITTFSFDEFVKYKNKTNINYDFILCEIPIVKKDNYEKYDTYVIRYENINDIMSVEYNSLKCFELNMIEMKVLTKETYNIDLGRNQYIINGNILFDRKFMKWYLNMYCNFILDDEDRYTITFIDHNMNYITLQDNCHLLIRKNNYDIVNLSDNIYQ